MINIDDRLLDELNESEMYLIMHIAKRMRANRMTAWPSLETLCKDCKWDERTVKKWRQSLVEKGFLSFRMVPGKPTIYHFLRDGIGVFAGLKNDEGYAEQEGTKNEGGTFYEGTQNDFKRVQNMPPELVNEKELVNEIKEKAANASSSEINPLKEKEKKEKPSPGARPKKAILKVDLSEKYQNFNDPAAIAQLWERWLKYRSDTGHAFKSEDSIITCFGKLQTYSKGDVKTAKEIVEASIGNGWQGLFEIKLPAAKAQSFQPQQKSGINRFGGDMDKYKEKPLF